jgi:hypothetical protein
MLVASRSAERDNALVMAIMVLGLPGTSTNKRFATGSSAASRSHHRHDAGVYLIRIAWVKLLGALLLY